LKVKKYYNKKKDIEDEKISSKWYQLYSDEKMNDEKYIYGQLLIKIQYRATVVKTKIKIVIQSV
jgi:hypothetical protein